MTSNRELLNQRLQKYRLTARFDLQSDGPQHAQRWKYLCYVRNTFVGRSEWHRKRDTAKEEAAGHALQWFDQYGYP
jgi:hypothetical protein